MKGLKCTHHLLRSRALLLLSVFVLSFVCGLLPVNNVNAVDYSVNLDYIDSLRSGGWSNFWKYESDSTNKNGSNPLEIYRDAWTDTPYDEDLSVVYSCTTNNLNLVSGDIYELTLNTRLTGTESSIGVLIYPTYFSSYGLQVISITAEYENSTPVTIWRNHNITNPTEYFSNTLLYYPNQSVNYKILVRSLASSSRKLCIGGSDNYIYTLPPVYSSNDHDSYTFHFQFNESIVHYSPSTADKEMNEKDDEDRENIESQQSESSDSSDDSQEEAESTGTTLLAAFSSFVTAITNASPSNCNLMMNMGNLNLGNVNLCQLSLPAEFQAIASIFMILFCVPLSIATARKVIDLFRSFQS